jgi:ABC-type Na+ efflux pump permease subunit
MKGIGLVVYKEWLNFARSDKSVFFVYFILIAGWGMLIASSGNGTSISASLWLVFFSVIIAANFASTVFVAERMTGSLEIFLTAGVTRGAIVYGKIAFVATMTIVIGALCALVGAIMRPLIAGSDHAFQCNADAVSYAVLYIAATLFNAASSACFSVWMPNPRLLHFINLLILAVIMSLYFAISNHFHLPLHAVSGLLLLTSIVFLALARRAFDSERIIKPVIL